MNVKSVEKLEKSQVAVTVEVTAEEFEAAVQKAYLKMRNKISVPGFRPGKAPRKMIEKLYGEGVFYSDAVDAALPDAYTQAIGSSGLDVVGYPEIEIVDDQIGKDGFTFKATVAVYPEVELGQYKGVSAVKEEVKVTADDVKERLNQMAEREARLVSVDRKVKKGDTAVIDFEGFDNGVAFEGGKGENYSLELGSHTFVPGFEEQLVGKNPGDDVTVPDAEFVYEGADEIPGRPQRIVDALLAANDAYDEMGDYSETGDTRLIMRGAGQLGVDWDDDTVHAIAEALEAIEQAIGAADGAAGGAAAGAAAPANAAPSADVEAIAQRFATVTVAADGLLRLIDLRKPSRAVPVMFYVNELCERLSVPRLCFKAEQLSSLMTARSLTNDDEAVLAETVKLFTMVAASEWKRHHDDVLWDAAEAKRLAKEEDERRNKEALAAKFAHVGDDPSKPPVEL